MAFGVQEWTLASALLGQTPENLYGLRGQEHPELKTKVQESSSDWVTYGSQKNLTADLSPAKNLHTALPYLACR